MTTFGIPPSPDRIQFRRRVMVVTTGWLAASIIGGIIFLISSTRQTLDAPETPAHVPPVDGGAEALRSSAYAAMRQSVEAILVGPNIEAVYWRDNVHLIEGDTIRFEGELDIEYRAGVREPFLYTSRVRLGFDDAWHLVEARVGTEAIYPGRGSEDGQRF